ncbi:MAG: 1-(5-phosphoribosyl)-5-[Clostridia bacterium]|nr:1-(5-phosphoribosyl)-5-[(5-phosphoribosylamino)methylideneamino]imidazole-4-carboxamide isomerase [Clostridia bacterium]
MNLFPAIDLYGGKAVRLYKGNYNEMTVYNDDPVAVAKDFEACGAKYIHLVDLEGAKTGETPNLDVISRIVSETNLFAEVGGGIRSMQTIEKYISAGVSRVILGTAAVTNQSFLMAALLKYGKAIAVGVDIRDGFVAIKGWTENSALRYEDFMDKLVMLGVSTVIVTDISRDGAMKGTNRSLYAELAEKFPTLNVIASGGVSSLDDVSALNQMNLYGAIIGKAYYTGAIDLKEAVKISE